MPRFTMLWIALICLLPSLGGCRICQSPEDATYAAFGGVWDRADPVSGRVGSAFEPAEGMVARQAGSPPQPLNGDLEFDDLPEMLPLDEEDDEFYYETRNRATQSR